MTVLWERPGYADVGSCRFSPVPSHGVLEKARVCVCVCTSAERLCFIPSDVAGTFLCGAVCPEKKRATDKDQLVIAETV